jgi:hypothetical protein
MPPSLRSVHSHHRHPPACTGILESSCKDNSRTLCCREPYFPPTKPYSLGECLADLLDMSARLLVIGGRLVYWMPDFNESADDACGDQECESNGSNALASSHKVPFIGALILDEVHFGVALQLLDLLYMHRWYACGLDIARVLLLFAGWQHPPGSTASCKWPRSGATSVLTRH